MQATESRGGDEPSATPPEIVGTPCIDGTPLSAADVRSNADKLAVEHAAVRRTIYTVARSANDAEDCRMLLNIIGIDIDIDIATVRAAVRPTLRPAGLSHQSDISNQQPSWR